MSARDEEVLDRSPGGARETPGLANRKPRSLEQNGSYDEMSPWVSA